MKFARTKYIPKVIKCRPQRIYKGLYCHCMCIVMWEESIWLKYKWMGKVKLEGKFIIDNI